MKKGIKKLLTVITVVCLAVACVTFATACNKTSLSLDVKEASVGVGQQVTITAKASDSVSWESADEDIAMVDAGVVTGVSVGKTTVTAKCKDKSATCEITVLLEISGDSSVMRYETISLTTNSTKSVTWESSDTSVLTVDNGTVTAISEGTAIVSATSNGVTGSKEITVISSTKSPSLTVEDSISVSETGGNPYTLEVTPLWGEDEYTGDVDYTWEFVSGESTDVATITPDALDDSLCVVTGVKEGSTKVKVSATIREKLAESVIDVTVRRGALSIEVETNDYVSLSFDDGANYIVDLTMIPTETTVSSADFVWSVFFGNDDVTDSVTYNWSDETVAKYESSKVNAVGVGTKDVELSFTYQDAIRGERTASIIVRVNVEEINLTFSKNTNVDLDFGTDGKSALENTGWSYDLSDISTDLGTIFTLTYDGKDISSDASLDGGILTVPVSVFGKTYGEKTIIIESGREGEKYIITLNVVVITKTIMNKTDLDNMGAIAKAFSNDNGVTWDGYFVLGADITYNGVYAGMFGSSNIWMSIGGWDKTDTRGFKGVFNGRAHVIDGMEIIRYYDGANAIQGGFIPTLMATGVIENVSFINASVTDSGFISMKYTETSTLKNIYVQYKSFIGDRQDTATFTPTNNQEVNASYIFVDCSKVETFTNSTGGWARTRFMDRGTYVNNNKHCYGVGNEKTVSQESTHVVAANVESLLADTAIQGDLKTWDASYWTLLEDGRIVPVNLAPKD